MISNSGISGTCLTRFYNDDREKRMKGWNLFPGLMRKLYTRRLDNLSKTKFGKKRNYCGHESNTLTLADKPAPRVALRRIFGFFEMIRARMPTSYRAADEPSSEVMTIEAYEVLAALNLETARGGNH